MLDMVSEPIDEHFTRTVQALPPGRGGGSRELPFLDLFDSQLGSRHVDLIARELGGQGRGFYSIGSSGHEGNAAVAAALRPSDPALLHYRSGAFYIERARQVTGINPLLDMVLGIVAAADEPISGGRHKVFGNAALSIIPLTSTIASHLPRAVGLALGMRRAAKLGLPSPWPQDAIVVCGFGDASANHSTALGALNAARHCAFQRLPLPVLFVCEDNGIGISVRTPPGWIAEAHSAAGLRYFTADATDLTSVVPVAAEAAKWVRTNRAPAFLHLRTVRLMGHAGSDVESAYRTPAEITADYSLDPLVRTASLLVSHGVLTPAEVLDRYEAKRAEVRAVAEQAVARPKLASAGRIMAPLATAPVDAPFVPVSGTLAQGINQALIGILSSDPGALVFGEDVARKGGVYGVTRGLHKKFGPARVFDTVLDEQSILGTALGTSLVGFLPIPEIQYLAYVHNALDQIRGEASTMRFFSNDQYRNPMIVRIAGLSYQKGFGGHFHNDNSVAALRDIPGVVIAAPARADDAAAMLYTCAAAARKNGQVCVFLEPIALYHTRDLHEPGDNGWLASSSQPESAPLGRARLYGSGTDLTIVSFANGVPMSLRVARRLSAQGIEARVLDLRWLAPLPVKDLIAHANETGRVLVADETRRTGGISEAVFTALLDGGYRGALRRVTSEDCFIPLGPAANHVLLSEDAIEKAALDLTVS
ncbi:alpha-ketoacid dehydrogenase subunit alpha/beta [Kibdelosporangium persicum]|uniref:Pyruvate/2-oxoglutarate dehydrogenase complex, dehydrogenase component beta subunit n=2 Tax=Kibdelosporangium persicum TaxID=2698649 RepID=A0ABX2EZ22_9PSEU|nr:Pyruvate/2-oxoglutarate dehydrogenase complex, dehydrogenase component beta subunit [Kibdelosporangium persicum]